MSYEAWGDGDDDPFEPAIEAGWINPDDQTKALVDVMNERLRQQDEEGWSAEHDDQHVDGDLAWAAVCYALHGSPGAKPPFGDGEGSLVRALWPWDAMWWNPKDRRSDLVRAAALLLAEIERLDRAEALEKGSA